LVLNRGLASTGGKCAMTVEGEPPMGARATIIEAIV
jgi:hypothetical protein